MILTLAAERSALLARQLTCDPLVRSRQQPQASGSTCAIGFRIPTRHGDGQRFIRAARKMGPETFFAIAVDGEAVGGIGFVLQQDVERVSAEIGYWLGEQFWGRGIATEALAAVTRYAIEQHRLTRLFAVPFAYNTASCRVLEKAGYVLEARLRRSAIKDGQVVDQFQYTYIRVKRFDAHGAGRWSHAAWFSACASSWPRDSVSNRRPPPAPWPAVAGVYCAEAKRGASLMKSISAVAGLIVVVAVGQIVVAQQTRPAAQGAGQARAGAQAPYFPERLDWQHKKPEEVGMNPALVNEAVKMAIAAETQGRRTWRCLHSTASARSRSAP